MRLQRSIGDEPVWKAWRLARITSSIGHTLPFSTPVGVHQKSPVLPGWVLARMGTSESPTPQPQ